MEDTRDWYYAQDGAQLGPVSLAELGRAIREGRCRPGDLVWTEGMGDWQPASSVPGLSSFLTDATNAYDVAPAGPAGPPPAYVPPAPTAGPGMQPLPYQGPAQYYAPRPPSHNGMAIGAFVCSIVALPMMCCSSLVGVPLSIVGLVLGIVAKKGMQRTGNFEGRGMALAAIWVSIGTLVLVALLFIVIVIAYIATRK